MDLKVVDADEKKTKNSTKDTYHQPNQDFDCNITESFMQQCQYLISEKFIDEGDDEDVWFCCFKNSDDW